MITARELPEPLTDYDRLFDTARTKGFETLLRTKGRVLSEIRVTNGTDHASRMIGPGGLQRAAAELMVVQGWP